MLEEKMTSSVGPASSPHPAGGVSCEYEPCMEKKCRHVGHGHQVWEAALGGSGVDVVCLWARTCNNYSQVKDECGRTALHAAATAGNVEAAEWLLKTQQCAINGKDLISGYTALHRSIYYGQLAVARSLIKHGADLNSRDNEGLTPLELCQMDRPIPFSHRQGDITELTVWGSNANYNLGLGHQEPRIYPDVAAEFRKAEMSLCQVEMNTYHTLFLTRSGKVYACGYGMGGRLGTGDEETVLNPSLVQLRNDGPCRSIAVGQDHSIFLTNSKVWTCGSNDHGQLGHAGLNTTKLCNPRTLDSLQRHGITGILAGPFHSIFFNTSSVFVCGLNKGQFGRGLDDKEELRSPTMLTLSFEGLGREVTDVGGNEFATAVCVDSRYIFLMRRHQHTRIDSKTTTSQQIVKLQVSGEKTSTTLFVLTQSGRVLIWREKSGNDSVKSGNDGKGYFTRVVFNNNRLLDIVNLTVSLSSLVVITKSGEAYKAGWSCTHPPSIKGYMEEKFGQVAAADFQIAVRTRRRRELEAPPMALELMKVKRVPNVYTAISASSDVKGNNFAILQRHQTMDVTDLPEVGIGTMFHDFKNLYDEADEQDAVCDVIFEINTFERFPAHRFILAAASPVFSQLVQPKDEMAGEVPVVVKVTNQLFGLEKVDAATCFSVADGRIFRAILDLVYTRQCSFVNGERLTELHESREGDNLKSKGDSCNSLIKDLGKLRSLCRRLRLESQERIVANFINSFEGYQQSLNDSRKRFPNMTSHEEGNLTFDRNEGDIFSDVTLQSNDGIDFKAHKCILVARLDYFKSLFSSNWALTRSTKGKNASRMILPFSSKALSILLECVYTNNADSLKEAEMELIGEVMACSDYVMDDRLMQLAESELSSHLSLKNVVDLLSFSWKYNGVQIKNTCFDFISLNLTAVLENRLLDNLPLEILSELSSYYRAAQRRNLCFYREQNMCDRVPEREEYEEAREQTPQDMLDALKTILVAEPEKGTAKKKTPSKPTRNRVRLRSRTLSESEAVQETEESTLATQISSLKLTEVECDEDVDKTPVGSPSKRELASPTTPPVLERKFIVPLPRNAPIKLGQERPTPYLMEFPSLGDTRLSSPASVKSPVSSITKPSTQVSASTSGATPTTSRSTPWRTPTKVEPTQNITTHRGDLQATPSPPSTDQAKNKISPQKSDEPRVSTSTSSKKKTKWRTIKTEQDISQAEASTSGTQQVQGQLTSDGRDRSNPWKVADQSIAKKESSQVVTFSDIVEDEVEKRRNFEKATSKSLPMMQIEDEVINWFTEEYSDADTTSFTELLSVERVVTSNVSAPTWVQHPGAVVPPTPFLDDMQN